MINVRETLYSEKRKRKLVMLTIEKVFGDKEFLCVLHGKNVYGVINSLVVRFANGLLAL